MLNDRTNIYSKNSTDCNNDISFVNLSSANKLSLQRTPTTSNTSKRREENTNDSSRVDKGDVEANGISTDVNSATDSKSTVSSYGATPSNVRMATIDLGRTVLHPVNHEDNSVALTMPSDTTTTPPAPSHTTTSLSSSLATTPPAPSHTTTSLSSSLATMPPAPSHTDFSSSCSPYSSYQRLYAMTYFPSAFWPRLTTRLLGDRKVSCLLEKVFPQLEQHLASLGIEHGVAIEWNCWKVLYLFISLPFIITVSFVSFPIDIF